MNIRRMKNRAGLALATALILSATACGMAEIPTQTGPSQDAFTPETAPAGEPATSGTANNRETGPTEVAGIITDGPTGQVARVTRASEPNTDETPGPSQEAPPEPPIAQPTEAPATGTGGNDAKDETRITSAGETPEPQAQSPQPQTTEPPRTPGTPLAHFIAGARDRVRLSWDEPEEPPHRYRPMWDPKLGNLPNPDGTVIDNSAPVTGYLVTRNDGRTLTTSGPAATVSDYEVEAGREYSYTVAARSEIGSSPPSTAVVVTVPPMSPAPVNLSATAARNPKTGRMEVNLRWEWPHERPVRNYDVTRSELDMVWPLGWVNQDTLTFTDTEPESGRTHRYQVWARTDRGTAYAWTEITIPLLRTYANP